ncbi:hypothetical protein KCM76_15705 [Zooshikella marina]|uniref:Uncharacterized protein n=1 Tax=Zooshikella ganghwensis TaxID=202772 RepID=A0A4P9VJA7_9GAMM|nr:hypothetical protein [Zooshikella ganghwensis]MBU2707438.1 hypothetical protein [Zooshikella ganghwensis]RDH42676.1 hypothetical protein B9G39_04010 [Zooshikella ganghwensis]
MKKIIIAILVGLFSTNVMSDHSWDGVVKGQIEQIDVSSTDDMTFRVLLKGVPSMCENSHRFAYLKKNNDSPVYDTYISALLAAKFAQAEVTIYSTKDEHGYCRIGYIVIR